MKQIYEEIDKKNTQKLYELDHLFKKMEALLSEIEITYNYSAFHEELIELPMDIFAT